jgi:hypothetical protein
MANASISQTAAATSIPKPNLKVGAFRRFIAFVVDSLIIFAAGFVFMPFSKLVEGMGRMDWFPMFPIGCLLCHF